MVDNIGMAAMIECLFGPDEDTMRVFSQALNKKITGLKMHEDALHFEFEDGFSMRLFDDGQNCCENRYMTCDDDLSAHVGGVFLGAEVRGVEEREDEYDIHEVQFLVVTTSKGQFTAETHNEHNGYYGGFIIRCVENTDD